MLNLRQTMKISQYMLTSISRLGAYALALLVSQFLTLPGHECSWRHNGEIQPQHLQDFA